ncbi:hypothetical protein [Candidatus Pelagisphaera phototrophica]|uniref:hypothetical protein n=1 Tax=Candidatus Pelagisphaera phototrophica TaxID=2684113 RepID=UPI0019E16A65|nr:hypothetical protein [Candidatus Pelagisphaera phototrophica]QXD31411.1 hypothetical protein GA004_13925 [Candidatus Pelagisphaera phototrophica]
MKNILINYAQNIWYNSQRMCSKTGISIGGFDEALEHSLEDISPRFIDKYKHILQHQRGAGYWLWKPYIIYKNLIKLDTDDVLFYSDSGSMFIGSFNDYMFDVCRDDEKGVILFKDNHLQKVYTKRDCLILMNCDSPEFLENKQLVAGFQLVRRTDFSVYFYRTLMEWAQDERIITDIPNTCGKPNYPEFNDHRHEQSILTNLQLLHDITTKTDPSQWGNDRRETGYKQLINCHRKNYDKTDDEYIRVMNNE